MFIFLFILSLLSSQISIADEDHFSSKYSISGKIFSNIYLPTTKFLPEFHQPLQQLLTASWLNAEASLSDSLTAHLVLAGTATQRTPSALHQKKIQLDPREAYLSYLGSDWELRMGRMIHIWGQMDGYSPTDFLTAKDLTLFNPDGEVQRKGLLGIWFTWTPAQAPSWNLTGIITPLYAQGKVLINPQLLPPDTQIPSDLSSFSKMSFNHVESAIQVSYSGMNWDLAFLAFHGWNHSPFFSYQPQTFAAPLSLEWDYQKILALGAHGSQTLKDSIYRWEWAYIMAQSSLEKSYYSPPSHFDFALSVEHGLSQYTRVQVQYLSKLVISSTPTPGQQNPFENAVQTQLLAINQILQNYQNRYLSALSSSIRYMNEEHRVSPELYFLINLVGFDYLVRPQIHYNWSESLKIVLGQNLFGGPTHRPLGALKPYSSSYIEFSYLF